jgi:cytochrome c peroxidase
MDKETADAPSQRTELIDLQTDAGIETAKKALKNIVPTKETEGAAAAPVALIQDAAVLRIGYKARPLNGIWATAPYLHNGSVPTLAELLKPECERMGRFHVGSIEFDKDNVGFKNDPTYPVFDTELKGNSNKGHDFGANLSKEERRQLLEFLKSL